MNPLFKFTFTICCLILISCDNEKESIPSYLHITKCNLTTNYLVEGANTHDITDVKIFANGTEIGTFEVPVTIPILAKGNVQIIVTPNIKENLNSNNRKYYKPYLQYTQTFNLKELQVDTIKPVFTYRSNTTFVWKEDFETGISLMKSGSNNSSDSLIRIPVSTTGVNQNFPNSSYCGYINISPKDTFVVFERSNINYFNLPVQTDVYVELDIKSNVNVQVGIYTDDGFTISQNPVLIVYPTNDNWKKVYVNLKPEIGGNNINTKTKLFFGLYKDQGDNTTNPKVYLDNIKLVYVN